MNFNLINELKKIILRTKHLKGTFSKKHPNSKYSLDLIINEIMYFLKSGVSWLINYKVILTLKFHFMKFVRRTLRSSINYKTLFWHYSNFVKYNVFYKLYYKIRNTYIKKYIINDTTLLIDSTIIYNKYGINKIGRNKFYKNKFTTKISLMTDINGFPLSVLFLKGNYHDNTVFIKHIRDANLIIPKIKKTIIADKAYSANKNYELLDNNNIKHIIPPRKNMKIATNYKYNKNEYSKRIKIEQIFSKLKIYKRIYARYDKYICNFNGFVLIALSIIATNIFNHKSNS
jgi:transposase